MRRPSIALASSIACLAAAGPAGAAVPREGTWVGGSGRLAIAAVFDRGGIVAYACDGRRVGRWLSAKRGTRASARLARGGDALTLTRRGKTVVARFRSRGQTRTARLRPARGRAGLYRAQAGRRLGGWIVLRSGRQVGVVASSGTLSTAPTLSTTTLTSGSLIAGRVLTATQTELLAVDVAGDGLDVDGSATTDLAGGGTRTVRAPRTGDDDALLAVDVAAAAAIGFRVASSDGTTHPVELVRSGLRVTTPAGTTVVTSDALQLLRLLDLNGDGALSAAEPRERQRAAVLHGALALRAAMLEADNDSIARQMAEAAEKAQEAMDAATTQLAIGLIAGLTSTAGFAQTTSTATGADGKTKRKTATYFIGG